MSVLCGLLGAIDKVDTVRNWRVTTNAALQSFVASNTDGMVGNLAGNKDWNGQYSAYGHTPVKMPGEAFAFLGSCDGVKGVSGTAIVDSTEISIDIETGSVISHVVNFSGNGALSVGVAAEITDEEDPAIYSSIARKVMLAAVTSEAEFSELGHVRTVVLRFAATNTSYVDSGSAGIVKRCKGNYSVGLSFNLYEESSDCAIVENLLPNTWCKVRVYVSVTEYWEFVSCIVENVSDFIIDREAAAICGFTCNLRFSGVYNDGTGVVVGSIKKPGDSTWWPNA